MFSIHYIGFDILGESFMRFVFFLFSLEVINKIRYNKVMKNRTLPPPSKEVIVDSYVDRLLGRYEKAEGTKTRFIYLLYQHGAGSASSFKMYWGRVDAKKNQSRSLSYYEVIRVHHEYALKGYEDKGGRKILADLEKDLLNAVINPIFLAKDEDGVRPLPPKRKI